MQVFQNPLPQYNKLKDISLIISDIMGNYDRFCCGEAPNYDGACNSLKGELKDIYKTVFQTLHTTLGGGRDSLF